MSATSDDRGAPVTSPEAGQPLPDAGAEPSSASWLPTSSVDSGDGGRPAGSGRRRRTTLIVAGALLVLGAAVGAGTAAAVTDPVQSEEYRALADEKSALVGQLDEANDRADAAERRAAAADAAATRAEDEAERRVEDLDERAAELDEREVDVAAREEAVTAVEDRIASTSIGEGIWTVGVDVEPGTYRVQEPLSGYCYWGIYRSGSNGSDIIENDGPEGGVPTVTLSAGQDFENSGCGTFVKQ